MNEVTVKAGPGRLMLISLCASAGLALGQASLGADPATKAPVVRNLKNQMSVPWMTGAPQKPAAPAAKAIKAKGTSVSRGARPAQDQAAVMHTTSVPAEVTKERTQEGKKTLKFTLQGGVTMNVPRTPEDVSKYLRKMKVVIAQYEQVAVASLLPSGGSGSKVDPARVHEAKNHSLDMIRQIRGTVPPDQLKDAHYQLATTLGDVSDFMENPGNGQTGMTGGFSALMRIQPLMTKLHNTMDRYHRGVTNCISYYNLDSSLDPFAGENEEHKQQLTGLLNNMKSNMLNPQKSESDGQPGGGASGLGGMDFGALGQMMGGLGGGTGDAGGGSPGESGGGSAGGGGLGGLGSLLGGGGGGGGGAGSDSTGGMGGLGSLLGGGGSAGGSAGGALGGLGGLIGGSGGGGGLGGSGNFDIGQLGKMLGGGGGGGGGGDMSQMGNMDGLKNVDLPSVIKQFGQGGSGMGGGDNPLKNLPGMQDPQKMDQLGDLLKQFQAQ